MTLFAILLFCISFKSSVFIVFSRVVHREPNVPSTTYKGSTLYEERDGMFGLKTSFLLEKGRIWSSRKKNVGVMVEDIACNNFGQFRVFERMNSL